MLSLLEAVANSGLSWHPVNGRFIWSFSQTRTSNRVTWSSIDRSPKITDLSGGVELQRRRNHPLHQRGLPSCSSNWLKESETHAYLPRRDALWRASVVEATVKPPDSRDPRFPSHYKPQHCNFFVRLRNDFLELPAEWLLGNAVLATQPEERPDSLASALNSQTNPLFLFELAPANRDGLSIARPRRRRRSGTSPVTLHEICDDVAERLRAGGLI